MSDNEFRLVKITGWIVDVIALTTIAVALLLLGDTLYCVSTM